MTPGSTLTGEVERFADLVAARLGLRVPADEHLDKLLRTRAAAYRDVPGYLRRFADGMDTGPVAAALTVGESYFCRHPEQLDAFTRIALPERARVRPAVSVLSAGCASGEEPYTLAMLALEHCPVPVDILAVDVDPDALARARAARYSAWALRATPEPVRRRWFRDTDGRTVPDARIRDAVRFEERNLAVDDPDLWRPQRYDIVFCRNVIMYLTPEATHRLLASIAGALAPGGYLFLGATESLRALAGNAFETCHTEHAFYYRRRESR